MIGYFSFLCLKNKSGCKKVQVQPKSWCKKVYINQLILLLVFHISTNNIKKIKYNNNGY